MTSHEHRGGTLSTDVDDDQLDIKRIIGVLWTRAPMIIALVVLAGLAAYAYSATKTDLYRATAKVRVLDPNAGTVFSEGQQLRVDPKRDLDTQLDLMRSDNLRAEVDQTIGDDARLINGVSMAGVGATDLIAISVSSPSPDVAATAANAFADKYVERRQNQVASGFTATAEELRSKSAELDAQIRAVDQSIDASSSASDRAQLEAQRTTLATQQAQLDSRATQLDVEAATRSGNVEVAEQATPPDAPYAPTPTRDAALAAILALLVGIGLAFLLDRLDDKVRSPDDAEAASGLPVVGAIPIFTSDKKGARRLSKSAKRALVPLDSTTAEAYRALRSNLRFSAIGVKRTSVLLTSSEGFEGKSTVAANLAVVLAESGLRVVLISADLRKPTLSSFFGVDETEKGLTSLLIGEASLVECLHRVPLASGRNLYLMPAGPLPQNPAEVLGSHGMRELLETIERAGADFILVDSPPVLPVADALSLSQFTDGVMVLTVAGRTPKGHLNETVDRLRQVNAELIGVVLNGVPTRGRYTRYYGGYGYGYRSGYGPGRNHPDVLPADRSTSPTALSGDVPKLFDTPAPTANGNGQARGGSKVSRSAGTEPMGTEN